MWKQKIFEKDSPNNPKYLVILLHGYGANAKDLIELSDYFKDALPDAHFIAPNAIENWEGGFPDCYQWFSLANGLQRKSLEDIKENIISSNQQLHEFISQKLKEFSLGFDKLFIIGFSQGAMMAKYQALINEEKIAGVIAFSGKLILPEMLGQKTNSKPNICLIHGRDDDVVDFSNFLESKKLLQQLNFEFSSHSLDNLGHSINLDGIKIAANFLKQQSK